MSRKNFVFAYVGRENVDVKRRSFVFRRRIFDAQKIQDVSFAVQKEFRASVFVVDFLQVSRVVNQRAEFEWFCRDGGIVVRHNTDGEETRLVIAGVQTVSTVRVEQTVEFVDKFRQKVLQSGRNAERSGTRQNHRFFVDAETDLRGKIRFVLRQRENERRSLSFRLTKRLSCGKRCRTALKNVQMRR